MAWKTDLGVKIGGFKDGGLNGAYPVVLKGHFAGQKVQLKFKLHNFD